MARVLLPSLLALALVCTACGSDSSSEAAGTTTAKTQKPKKSEKANETRHVYKTRPDLHPPIFEVTMNKGGTAPGYIFLAAKEKTHPGGPMILDDRGEVVWFREVQPRAATDFRVQTYRGKPVLTWYQGKVSMAGIGEGHYVIADTSYKQIAEFDMGRGVRGDLHEFLITPRNTAYVVGYRAVPHDLSSVGGPQRGWVYDSIVQEVDIASKRVLFDWRSLQHVPIVESKLRLPAKKASSRKAALDYFHVNSVDVDDDGNLLVSARNTHTVYKVGRRDGRVIWRLGGSASDFAMGPGTTFGYQHDVRREDDGTVTLFDNSAIPAIAKFSRGLVLKVDEKAKTATLVHAYVHPKEILSPHQGNEQRLPDGHVVVGWGGKPYVTEYTADGPAIWDGHLVIGDTYRAYRFPWSGHPTDRPRVVVDGKDVYVSWNGATDVVQWEVLAGSDAASVKRVKKVDWTGFETKIPIDTDEKTIVVRALDGANRPLHGGSSRPVERS